MLLAFNVSISTNALTKKSPDARTDRATKKPTYDCARCAAYEPVFVSQLFLASGGSRC